MKQKLLTLISIMLLPMAMSTTNAKANGITNIPDSVPIHIVHERNGKSEIEIRKVPSVEVKKYGKSTIPIEQQGNKVISGNDRTRTTETEIKPSDTNSVTTDVEGSLTSGDEGTDTTFNDGDIFTAQTTEGITMTFKVISASEKTCQVGKGGYSSDICINANTSGAITIPRTIKGLTVTAIGRNAFYKCNKLTSVIIPNSVTSISDHAFYQCSSLTAINLPLGLLSVEDHAFFSCGSAKTLTLPSTLKSIGHQAFDFLSGLTSIRLPASVSEFKGIAFAGCTNVTTITVDAANPYFDSRNNCNAIVETKSNTLIASCRTTIIPSSVTAIGSNAFWRNSTISSITIPRGVKSISSDAFENCSSLSSISVEGGNSVYDSRDNCNAIIESHSNTLIVGSNATIIPISVTGIGDYAFSGRANSNFTSINIPSGIKTIGRYAFYDCYYLNTISIPSTVSHIMDNAFYYCSNLSSINLSEGIKSIGHSAFEKCKSLKSFNLPSTLLTIGDYVFRECSVLTSITIPRNVEEIGNQLVANCPNLTTIKVDTQNPYFDSRNNCNAIVQTATNKLMVGCNNSIVPNSVNVLGLYCFAGCTNLTSITLPNRLSAIESSAFSGCNNLKTITCMGSFPPIISYSLLPSYTDATLYVPKGMKNTYANSNVWSNFTDIREMANVEAETFDFKPNDEFEEDDLKYRVNYDWNTVTIRGTSNNFTGGDLIIPAMVKSNQLRVTTIGSNAFSNNKSLKSVTISAGVKSIEGSAFSSSSLSSVIIPGSVISIGQSAFISCNSLQTLTLPEGVQSIGSNAFWDCDGLKSVTIPKSLTMIDRNAFNACSDLQTITVAAGNPMYDSRNDCNAIIETNSIKLITGTRNTIIPEGVLSIGECAFISSGMSSLKIPSSVKSIDDDAFRCSNMKTIEVDEGNQYLNSYDNCNAIIETATNTVLYGCINTVLPKNVIKIGAYAFTNCRWKEFAIPEGIVDIGNDAFWCNRELTSVSLPSTLQNITGQNIFSQCDKLKTVICHSLTPPVSSLYGVGFPNNGKNMTLYVPKNTKEAYEKADAWKNFGNIIELEDQGPEAYAVLNTDQTTLSFYYDENKTSRQGKVYTADQFGTTNSYPKWIPCSSITTVVFDDSFAEYDGVTSTYGWFLECMNITTIVGIENLNTTNVTNMNHMFSYCSSLTSLDLSKFNTVNVIDMNSMFYDCSNLININLNSFNTTNVANMSAMFCNCRQLMRLDLSKFNTANVTDMRFMFNGCSELVKIEIGKEWDTSRITQSENMFTNCISLVGGDGTKYNPNYTDKTKAYAGHGGYLTLKEQINYDCDWTIGKGGDFADIKAAMEDSRVQDGHVLQLLPGTSIGGSSYINNKAVTIKGNGYKDTSDGYIGSVYIDCDNVTLQQLYLGNVYIRANNATIEHCRAGYISGTENYDADDATIRGCFVTGTVHSYYNNVCYGWNISNNIIFASNVWGNILDYLEEATVDHNLIINYNNENITGVYAVGAVKHSSFTNNIFIRQMFSQGISPDATDSAVKFEYNIVSNTGTYSKWPTNKTGYRNMEELFVCTGEWTTDTYYKLAAGSPAIGYANDGGNCGPWSGKYPYWKDGIEPDPTHWKLDPTLTTDPQQYEFATLDELIGYMTDNLNKLKESVTVNVADATYTMDVLSYLFGKTKYDNVESMIEFIRARSEVLLAQMDHMTLLISQGITFNMEAPHEAIFQFNIQNSESLALINELINDQVAAWLAQGMSQGEVEQRILWLSEHIADTQTRALRAMKWLADNITLTNISVYIDGKLYPADPTNWKLDPKLTTDPEQYEFASLEALMNYLTDTKNIQKLPEGTTVNVAVADTTFAMDAIQDYSNENDVDVLLKLLWTETARMSDISLWLRNYCNAANITINMVAQQGAVFQFYFEYSQAYKHAQELMAAKEKELLAQGVSQSEVNERKHNWQNSLYEIEANYRDLIPDIFQSINTTNITIQRDPMPQWKLDPKLTTNAEQHEFATLDGFVNYLLDNCLNLKESIKVNVADATYTMDVIPNLGNSNDVMVLIKELKGTCDDLNNRVAEIVKWFQGNNITINMEAPHAAVLQFNIRNSQAVKQLQKAIPAKMQEMLAQGMSQDDVNLQAAIWYNDLNYLIEYSYSCIDKLSSLIKATNISLVVDPTQQWKLDPKLNNNPEQYEFATLEALVSYLLTHPLTESITVNVADATYSMEMMPNDIDFSNYSVDEAFDLVRQKMSVIKAMLDYYAAYPLISIYMKAPNEAIFKIYMQKCLALYYQIPAYLNYKAYEMLAEGKSRTEVEQQRAVWKAELDQIKNQAHYYMQMLANRIRTTNISILIDPDSIPVPGPIIDPDDMLCLRNLYDRLGGSSWTNKKWKFNGYMAQKEDFPGVTFDDEGYVVEINLENNNLRGSLNPSGWTWELGLPRLSGLYLQKNNISGNLSPWLHDTDRAGRLKTLNMSYNNLTKISDSIPSSITSLNLKNQNREWYRPSGVTIDPLKIEVMANMPTVRLYLSSKQKVSLPSLFTYNHQNQTHDAKPDIHIVNAQGLDKYGSFYSTTEGSYALSWMNEEYTEKQDAPCYIRFGGPYDGSVYPAYLRYIEGDANISGYTDIVDVQTTLNYVLAGGGVSQFNRSAANTYVDNQINVQDIVCTVNIVLDDVAAPEDIVTTSSSTRRRLRRAAEAFDAQGWLYTNQGRVLISSAEEVGSIDVELKGVSTRQVSLMLNHSQYQMIGRDTEFGSRYIIFSPTGQPIPTSEEVTLLAVSSQAEVVAAQAADMEAQEMTLAIGQPTGIAQVLGGSMNATFQGDELVVTTTTDIQNLSLRLYSTGGQMVLVNEEDNMPKGELRMKAPVSPGAYILEMTTRQGGRKIVKLMKR